MLKIAQSLTLIAAATGVVLFADQAFAGCEEDMDALSKAISGPVTMAVGHRAAIMRMALSGYDRCMAGDSKGFDDTREQIMTQIRQSLGGL